MSPESTLDRSLRDAHRARVAAQLPHLAWVVFGCSIMWFVFAALADSNAVRSAAPLGVVIAILVVQGGEFAGATALCRSTPTGGAVVPIAVATCFVVGLVWVWILTVTATMTSMLTAGVVSMLSAAPLVLSWGLAPQLVFQGSLTIAWFVALGTLPRHLPLPEIVAAISVGNLIALVASQWASHAFRGEVLARFAALEFDRQLAASLGAYRALAENAVDFIWAIDLDGRWTYVNEALARRCGRTVASMIGQPVRDILVDHPGQPDPATLIARLASGEPVPPQLLQMTTVDGPRWVEAVSAPVLGSHGEVVGVQGSSRDVTEKRLAEHALRTSEERFRSFAESMASAMLIAQRDGITYVNPAVSAMTGFDRGELLGKQVWDLVHPDERATARAKVTARLDGARLLPYAEYRLATKSGEPRWVDIRVTMVELEGVPTMLATALDVTERKLAEQALRASEARYRGLVESQREIVLRFDARGRVTFANDAYCDTYGVPREDVIGQEFWPLVHEDDVEPLRAAVAATMRPPYRDTVEVRSRTVHGWRWFEWEASAVSDGSGMVLEGQATGRDVTERRRAQDALRASLEELQQSQEKLRMLAQRQVAIREEERKRLSFDLHDDVCQELVAVGILVESVAGRLGAAPPPLAADLTRATRYLREVVDHLRLLARDLRPLALADFGLESSLRALATGLSTERTSVETAFAAAIPRLDESIEVTIYRIAQEAVTNAVRHADARHVAVTLAVAGERLYLSVSDDGRGFDVAASELRALGLASMRERAQALSGRLEVRSLPGEGTTVELDMPLVVPTSATAA